MLVLKPKDRWCLLEQFSTLGVVFGILVVKVHSILVVKVGVEGNIMVASKYKSLLSMDAF